jgi:hypothetical protein
MLKRNAPIAASIGGLVLMVFGYLDRNYADLTIAGAILMSAALVSILPMRPA